jgi:hypothetical protein
MEVSSRNESIKPNRDSINSFIINSLFSTPNYYPNIQCDKT